MNYQEFTKQLKEKKLVRHYILLSNDILLIKNALDLIKSTINVNESFDYEVYSITDVTYEEVVGKLYVLPFVSSKRMLVIKNLETLDNNKMQKFAEKLSNPPSSCCLVMTFQLNKGLSRKKMDDTYQKIQQSFPSAQCIPIYSDREFTHKTVISLLRKMNINFSPEFIQYFTEAFTDDLVGLENELSKIRNYLSEVGQLPVELKNDFLRSLGGFTKYTLANAFIEGKKDILVRFEQLKPYLQSPAEVVDALIRVINSYFQKKNIGLLRAGILDELARIDLRIKSGSNFGDVFLEIFFSKNRGLIK